MDGDLLWDPVGLAVLDPTTEVVEWPATFHFWPERARRAVGEARSDQSDPQSSGTGALPLDAV